MAARSGEAKEIIDPEPFAVGSLEGVYRKYEVGPVLPAMGYSRDQLAEMERVIDSAGPEVVVIASPIDLSRLIAISAPTVRVTYELRELEGSPTIRDALAPLLD